MSDMVEIPEDQFSRGAAQMVLQSLFAMFQGSQED